MGAYINANYGVFTYDVLRAAVLESGNDRAAIDAALAQAAARGAGPVRARARLIVRLAYAITYGLLVAGMLMSTGTNSYGAGPFGMIILTMVLGAAFLTSVVWLRPRRRRAVAAPDNLGFLLSLPLVLLVLVAGTCLATGLPLPPTI
jgi:hypothetical protein